jgi:hypothetical protein
VITCQSLIGRASWGVLFPRFLPSFLVFVFWKWMLYGRYSRGNDFASWRCWSGKDDVFVVSISLTPRTVPTSCSTYFRRISKGNTGHSSGGPITLLRDGDQPFIFDIRFFNRPYRFEFYDTASPVSWKLLNPKLIVLCYDISSRLSLINMKRFVRLLSLYVPLVVLIFEVAQRNQKFCRNGFFWWIRSSNSCPRIEERSKIRNRSQWHHLSAGSSQSCTGNEMWQIHGMLSYDWGIGSWGFRGYL